MELYYEGKTKNVYQLEDGNFLLAFKDDVTGVDGTFDPGANQVGLSIEGMGAKNVAVTSYFFKQLNEEGIATHYIDSDVDKATMTVVPAKPFGQGLEVIIRYRAVGSFIRRYGAYIEEGTPLDAYVEMTIKDDDRQDPLITEDALAILDILSHEEYQEVVDLTRQIASVIKEDLAAKGLDLYDLKLEFGRDQEGNILLIDEISGGNMRVYQDERYIDPETLSDYYL